MSTTHPQTDTCKYCGEDYTHYHAPGYCSAECHARGMRIQARDRARRTGRELLNTIQDDHRICSTCYRVLKEVEWPKPTSEFDFSRGVYETTPDGETTYSRCGQEVSEDAAIGFEHPTPDSQSGPYGRECTCGAVSHTTEEELIQQREPVAWHLNLIIEQLRREEAIPYEFEIPAFCNMLYESGDLARAVGEAIHE